MKKHIHFIIALITISTGQLQAQENQQCLQNLSIFAENAKVKNYTAAYEPWKLVRRRMPKIKCGHLSPMESVF